MRIDRLAVTGVALVAASLVMMSCGSSDNTTPANTVGGVPAVSSPTISSGSDTTLATGTTLP